MQENCCWNVGNFERLGEINLVCLGSTLTDTAEDSNWQTGETLRGSKTISLVIEAPTDSVLTTLDDVLIRD